MPNTDINALLKRIKSLEEALGLAYVPKDFKDDYAEHIERDYGFMNRVDKFIESLTPKKKR